MQTDRNTLGIGNVLGGLLDLSGIGTGVEELSEARRVGGEAGMQRARQAVRKMRESGAYRLREAARSEGSGSEASVLYDRAVTELRSASERGDDEAARLLSEMEG